MTHRTKKLPNFDLTPEAQNLVLALQLVQVLLSSPEILKLIVLGDEQLGLMLDKAQSTIRSALSVRPHTLPPVIRVPGSRRPRWLLTDVIEFLEKHKTHSAPGPKRPGRRRTPINH